MATGVRKAERIEIRVSASQKALIQRAAQIQTNGDVSAFILASAEPSAKSVLLAHDTSDVTAEIRERFYALLLNPPDPNDALIALFAEPATSAPFRLIR